MVNRYIEKYILCLIAIPLICKNLSFFSLDGRLISVFLSFFIIFTSPWVSFLRSSEFFKFSCYLFCLALTEFILFQRFQAQEMKVLESLFVGLISSYVFFLSLRRCINILFSINFALFFLGTSQILQALGMLPDALLLNPSLAYYDSRYAGFGYINDNGLVYMLGILLNIKFGRKYPNFILPFIFMNRSATSLLTLALTWRPKYLLILSIILLSFLSLILTFFDIQSYFEMDRFRSLLFRFALWQVSFSNFIQGDLLNIIFGYGVDAGRKLTLPLQEGNPHSNFLGILYYYGLWGAAVTFYFLCIFFKDKRYFPVLMVLIFYSFVHEFFYSAAVVLMFSLLFCMSLNFKQSTKY